MAHMISTVRGSAEMVWAGQMPWHGLGIQIQDNMTLTGALAAAGGAWDTAIVPLYRRNAAGEYVEVAGRVGTVRPDRDVLLGTVGNRWTPIHNRACAEFLETLAGEGGVRIETVGFLGSGERNFWTVRLGADVEVKPGDPVSRYLVLVNYHDGMGSLRAFWSPVRVVCNNTLTMALNGAKREGVSIRHTANAADRMREARRILGLAEEAYDRTVDAWAGMAATPVPDKAELDRLLAAILPAPADATDRQKKSVAEDRRQVAANIAGEARILRPGQRGISRWDVLNGLTYYTSHQQIKAGHGATGKDERRFDSVLSGSGAELVATATKILLTRDGKEIEVPADVPADVPAPVASGSTVTPLLDSMLS